MLNPEKVKDLKRLIDQQLKSLNVYDNVRQLIDEYVNENGEERFMKNEQHIIRNLREKSIIDQLIHSFRGQSSLQSLNLGKQHFHQHEAFQKGNLHQLKTMQNKRLLHVKLNGAKAFLEYVNRDDFQLQDKMICCLHFGKQRFQSFPVPCCSDPPFDDDFLLDLSDEGNLYGTDVDSDDSVGFILQQNIPLHLVVIRVDEDGQCQFVGGHTLEWRKVLKKGVIIMSVELGGGTSVDVSVPKGIIELRLELLPRPTINIPETEINQQLSIENARERQAEKEFYIYSKQWFDDFLQIRESHKERLVKVYVEMENGVHKPVISFVQPIRAPRLIESPSHAARFSFCRPANIAGK